MTIAMFAASAAALTACAGTDAAAPATTAPTAATAATAATTTAAATAGSSAPAVSGGADDKRICQQVDKAGKTLVKDAGAALLADATNTAPVEEALTAFAKEVDAAVAGSDSKVATAAGKVSKAATEGAASANPLETLESGSYEKNFKEFQAACKSAGVTIVG